MCPLAITFHPCRGEPKQSTGSINMQLLAELGSRTVSRLPATTGLTDQSPSLFYTRPSGRPAVVVEMCETNRL